MCPRVLRIVLLEAIVSALIYSVSAHAASMKGGGDGRVLLRYRFRAGEHLRYRLGVGTSVTLTEMQQGHVPVRRKVTSPSHYPGLLDERVLSVSRMGIATIAVSLTVEPSAASPGIQAMHRVPTYLHHLFAQSQHEVITISPRGVQHMAHGAAVALLAAPEFTLTVFPQKAVRLGAPWTTPLPGTAGRPAGERPIIASVVSGYTVARGEPSAIIVSTVRAGSSNETGATYIRERVTDHAVFAIQAGYVVTVRYTIDLEQGVGGRDAHGRRGSVHARFIQTIDAALSAVRE